MENIQMWRKLKVLILVFLFNCDFTKVNSFVYKGDKDLYVNLANSVYAWNGSCAILPCTLLKPDDVDYYLWFHNPIYDHKIKDFNGTIIYQSKKNPDVNTPLMPKNVAYFGKTEKDCTIVITNLRKEDAGFYQLRVILKSTEKKWMSKSNLSLSVSHTGPSLKLLHPLPEMQENKEVTLTCSIDYYCPSYDANLTWLHNVSGKVDMKIKKDISGISMTTTMTFLPTWKDHKKNISCVLERLQEETDRTTIQLDVKYRPQNVQINSESPIEIIEGEAVTLKCSVGSSNPPNPMVTWYKNGEILKTQGYEIRCKDSGKYHCKAENYVGNRISNAVEISVLHPPKNVLILQQFGVMEEGSQVILRCSTVANPPVYRYIWYKNDRLFFNSTDSYYTFSSITEADSGTYKCKAINDQGHQSSPPLHLDVKYAPKNVKVVINPDVKTFREGTKVSFECTVNSSNPEVTDFAWKQNNKFVASFSINKLIEAKDAGIYRCEATNKVGTSSSDDVSVEVVYPPKEPKCQVINGSTKKEGDQLTLQCETKQSNPVISRYEWFKSDKLYKTTNSNSLAIPNLQWTDAGHYSCKAINSIGGSKGDCSYLSIKYSPKNVIIKVSPGNSVTENTKVQLNCMSTAKPDKLLYTWYHNNQPLPKYEKEYALASIQMSQAGEYYCVVKNEIGSNQSPAISLHVSYSSSTIAIHAASGIVPFIILVIIVALIVRFGLKICRRPERKDLSFFVLNKPRNELSDQLDQNASSDDSLNERISYASLRFPASNNGGQRQSRVMKNHPDPNDIYSVVNKPVSTAEYENIQSSKKNQDESEDDIHYSIITNLNRSTVRERGPDVDYAMLKQ
ncbi:B-cell receptor CD22 [Anomaloglossus baeobatrachus]|uniref:B-cell receptor CD22 isoform X2 n=1 Tax=Anomaloglossus baeobatrachus TaxID=238106 RepID=UPI003F4FAD87